MTEAGQSLLGNTTKWQYLSVSDPEGPKIAGHFFFVCNTFASNSTFFSLPLENEKQKKISRIDHIEKFLNLMCSSN